MGPNGYAWFAVTQPRGSTMASLHVKLVKPFSSELFRVMILIVMQTFFVIFLWQHRAKI